MVVYFLHRANIGPYLVQISEMKTLPLEMFSRLFLCVSFAASQ